MKKTTKKAVKIKATLKMFGKEYKAEGKTVEEVFNKFDAPISKTAGVVTFEKGKLKSEKIIPARVLSAVLGQRSPTVKEIMMQHITILFNEFND